MQRLDQGQLTAFMQRLSGQQADIITLLRTTILAEDPQVRERVEDGKWLRGYLKYESPQGQFVYALGTTANGAVAFHAMPYYGSADLRERYSRLLEPFVAGKSCFAFTASEQVPISVLAALVRNGSQRVDERVAQTGR